MTAERVAQRAKQKTETGELRPIYNTFIFDLFCKGFDNTKRIDLLKKSGLDELNSYRICKEILHNIYLTQTKPPELPHIYKVTYSGKLA